VLLPDAPIGPEGRPGQPVEELRDVILPLVYQAAELGYIDISPYYRADRIHTSLLIIHGRDDTGCPVREAEMILSANSRPGGKTLY
jgi:dipeptidyl aminopeptidase/acylaminoacyl peptidase